MDWYKAKTVLIIALLITCLILGGVLLLRNRAELKADKDAADAVLEYLKNQGVSVNCDLPLERPSLPVLFVELMSGNKDGEVLSEYKGLPVESNLSGSVPVLSSEGDKKAKIRTAGSALLSACTEGEGGVGVRSIKGLSINSVKLVYYVGAQSEAVGAKDTAIPCWKIETDRGSYYINAYAL